MDHLDPPSPSAQGAGGHAARAAVRARLERQSERTAERLAQQDDDGDGSFARRRGGAAYAQGRRESIGGRPAGAAALPGTDSAARRDRPIAFDLPDVVTAADAVKASSAILAACAAGALSPGEAAVVMGLTKTHVGTLETAEIEARLTALERSLEHASASRPD